MKRGMDSKGSLNLAIEAIVIVVIAMTILGLGLGFVRNQFKTFGNIAEETQEQIKQQLLEDLRTGDKKLTFPSSKYTVETGEEIGSGVGVKNTGDNLLNFRIEFLVKIGSEFMPFVSEEEATFGTDPNTFTARIDWDDTPQKLKQTESRFYPIAIRAPDKQGNYLLKARIIETDSTGNPLTDDDGNVIVYDEKTFFIKTS